VEIVFTAILILVKTYLFVTYSRNRLSHLRINTLACLTKKTFKNHFKTAPLAQTIEQLCIILEPVFENMGKKSNAGCKPIDPAFIFRALFLQRLYVMGDAQIEYHLDGQTSTCDFLGI